MKNAQKKLFAAAMTLALAGNAFSFVMAEETASEPVSAPAPVVVEEKAPEVEKPKAEPADVTEKVAEKTETKQEPATEAPAAVKPEPTVRDTGSGASSGMSLEEAMKALREEKAMDEAIDRGERFAGWVEVEIEAEEQLFYGDEVTLHAKVSDANMKYGIRWEVNMKPEAVKEEWVVIPEETKDTYSFTVTEGNAEYSYRAVLVVSE